MEVLKLMNSSIEKISAIEQDVNKVRDELLILQNALKETLLINNEMIDNNLLNDLISHLDNFKEIKIPELKSIINTGSI